MKSDETYPIDAVVKAKESLYAKGVKVYDFSTGDPLEPTPPAVRKALITAVPEVSRYPTLRGRKDLRDAIAYWFKKRFGVSLSSEEEVIVTSGAKEAIFHFHLVFIQPERRNVIYGTPGYPVYEKGALFAGGKPYPVHLTPEDGYLLRLDRLPRALLEETSIVWINYPHNPTGVTAPLSYLEDTYHLCRELSIVLCSDECYTELYYEEPPHSVLEVGKRGAVVFQSLSKRSGMAGYRSGFVAGDAELIQRYLKARSSFGVASPDFVQQSARVAWLDEEHVKERRETFRRKRDTLLKLFEELHISYLEPKATLYIWARPPDGSKARDYAHHLLKYHIVVSPGEVFGDENFFRVALVPTLKECQEAVDVWREAHKTFICRREP